MGRDPKRLGIIVLSYNDQRVLQAIASIRDFDDIDTVSLVVVDGGSHPDLVAGIGARLTADDVLISEPDEGIFDALNKGLDASRTEYIGWLGSDDVFSGEVKASEVVRNLALSDLFIASTAHVQGRKVVRITHSWPSRHRALRFMLNNPHFSTFGRSSLLKLERFSSGLRGADIEYFLRIFEHGPKVSGTPKISTFMEIGGFSSSGYRSSLKTHLQLYDVYRLHMSVPMVVITLTTRFAWKFLSTLYFRAQRHVASA